MTQQFHSSVSFRVDWLDLLAVQGTLKSLLQYHSSKASIFRRSAYSAIKRNMFESVMPSSHLILCHPLLLLPPIPPSIRVFSNKSILKEISPGCSLEGMMLKLKLQYFGHLM